MRAPCSFPEAILIVGLCLFAIGSARASAATHIARMHQGGYEHRVQMTTPPGTTICRDLTHSTARELIQAGRCRLDRALPPQWTAGVT